MVPSRARGVGRRALAAGLLGLVLLLGRAAAAGGAPDAERFVSALGERTLVALRGSADPQQRVRDLAGLLDQAVDVELVGRLAPGRRGPGGPPPPRRAVGGGERGAAQETGPLVVGLLPRRARPPIQRLHGQRG